LKNKPRLTAGLFYIYCQRMGRVNPGAIIAGGKGTAEDKFKAAI